MAGMMTDAKSSRPQQPIFRSIFRGVRKRCPNCGIGRIFKANIKPAAACSECNEKLGHIRTDDFAPWLMILVTGHIVVSLVLFVEMNYAPPLWVHTALWTPTIIILTALMLPHTKGACLGFLWALGLSGDETQ
jgi:uncharacterized protein (DUF983 family)